MSGPFCGSLKYKERMILGDHRFDNLPHQDLVGVNVHDKGVALLLY